MDMRLELVPVPVSDVDRAKTFYVDKLGFTADHDRTLGEEIRFVQLTPPGSGCSIAIGRGVTEMAPGSVKGLTLVVSDIEAMYARLAERGIDVSEPQLMDWGAYHASFTDPDGNTWELQAPGPGPRGG
jgi:catechol 2,3-dioxygenase-like lactoylglutathione lyase family enzyme